MNPAVDKKKKMNFFNVDDAFNQFNFRSTNQFFPKDFYDLNNNFVGIQ